MTLVGRLVKPVRLDNATQKREKITFTRVLIEMDITKQFPGDIQFENEQGVRVSYSVEYEWHPPLKEVPKQKNNEPVRKIWRPKPQ